MIFGHKGRTAYGFVNEPILAFPYLSGAAPLLLLRAHAGKTACVVVFQRPTGGDSMPVTRDKLHSLMARLSGPPHRRKIAEEFAPKSGPAAPGLKHASPLTAELLERNWDNLARLVRAVSGGNRQVRPGFSGLAERRGGWNGENGG